jgi:hypothetical protein
MTNEEYQFIKKALFVIASKLPLDEEIREALGSLPSSLTEASEKRSKHFIPPTVDEVQNYLTLNNYLNPGENAERFVNFYESKGWMVGKNKMKSWQSAIKSWSIPKLHSRTTKIIV